MVELSSIPESEESVMPEVLDEPVGQNIACNTLAAPAIIPASALFELLFRELVAAKRALREASARVDTALDRLKEEKLKS